MYLSPNGAFYCIVSIFSIATALAIAGLCSKRSSRPDDGILCFSGIFVDASFLGLKVVLENAGIPGNASFDRVQNVHENPEFFRNAEVFSYGR
jgi:hypothetical protein